MLTQLVAVARRTGYPVVEVAGWKTRGRPGGMSDIRTIICHHTANGGAPGNYPSLRVVRDGRPGLPGPLAQYGLGVDGTIYVIAAGKSNHAGVSRSNDYTNSHAIGIEAEAVGVPGAEGDWSAPQMDSYARLCAALVDEFHLSVSDVRGHKETCAPVGRKSDPSFSMDPFRARVGVANLKTSPTQEVPTVELTDKIKLSESAARAMSIPGYTPRRTGEELSLSYIIQWGGPGAYRTLGKVETLKTQYAMLASQLNILTAAVAALAAQSPDGIRAAFQDGMDELKEELEAIDVQVSLSSGETEDVRE